ncbi:MAG: family 20 glycosylhydrolase [Cyclobacteriaceae bacterium]
MQERHMNIAGNYRPHSLTHDSRLTTRVCFYLLLFCLACVSPEKENSSAKNISVRWEIVSNLIDTPNAFEARFTLKNHGTFDLDDKNWALFFNIAPRPILENKVPQPATVRHINGDWYKLIPNENFSLLRGDTIAITYTGTEGVIKETDRPLGLYFVFYEDGKEEKIVEVSDYSFVPFTSKEQINRSPQDEEPIPTPEWTYNDNESLSRIPFSEIKPIIPSPFNIQTGSGSLELNSEFYISYQSGLENEAAYLAQSLKDVTGNEFKITDNVVSGGRPIQLLTEKINVGGGSGESYILKIRKNGISIAGSDPAGVFYGIQSLRSLIPLEIYRQPSPSIVLPIVTVEDTPRFRFRGLHIDVSRNFQTKETILRILDLLSFYKINRFLLYTTEDEGWRLEIDGLPELTTVGAERQHTLGKETAVLHPAYGSGPYPDGDNRYGKGHYTRQDFIEILRYAKARHIKVIPEVNFPAHARAAIKAMEARYQRFMKKGKEKEANEYRLIDPEDRSQYLSAQAYTDNVVSVARESTFRFYEKVVDEIAKMYRDAGLVMDEIHAGGDEVPEGAWTRSPMASELLKEHPEIRDPKNLQTYFFRELLKRLKKRNLRVDGWEEVFLLKNDQGGYDPNPEFAGENVVPFIWNNLFDFQDLGYRLANAGYRVVLCNVSNFYFDLAYSKDPKEPGLYWGGFVDTRNAWLFAPFDMYKTTLKSSMGRQIDPEKEYANKERLKIEARKNILGLEAQLWSETIKGRDMIEYYMLPKLLGFSESAWARERDWETVENKENRERLINRDWNLFANTLGQKEVARLTYLNGGYNYRIPPPGAIVRDGILMANSAFPGLTIRYTTDGSEPGEKSAEYLNPVKVSGGITLKTFDASGKSSRSVQVTNPLNFKE